MSLQATASRTFNIFEYLDPAYYDDFYSISPVCQSCLRHWSRGCPPPYMSVDKPFDAVILPGCGHVIGSPYLTATMNPNDPRCPVCEIPTHHQRGRHNDNGLPSAEAGTKFGESPSRNFDMQDDELMRCSSDELSSVGPNPIWPGSPWPLQGQESTISISTAPTSPEYEWRVPTPGAGFHWEQSPAQQSTPALPRLSLAPHYDG